VESTDVGLNARNTKSSQDEPQFQGTEVPCQWNLKVLQIKDRLLNQFLQLHKKNDGYDYPQIRDAIFARMFQIGWIY